ncbi:MAG TPA: hypothetical protein VGE13_04455 [Candidatus Saccharimonadales bacterium]
MPEQEYIPGVCNINRAEIAYRRKAMWFGVVLTLVIFVLLLLAHVSGAFRLVLFVPLYIASIGYLQVKNRFCVAYGTSGKQNAGEHSTSSTDVDDQEALKADKKKSLRMNLQAFVVSATLTILAVLLPAF